MSENWKPIVWSESIQKSLKSRMVFSELVNDKAQGAVTGLGDTIKILGVNRPTVTKITNPNAQLSAPEQVTDNATLIRITQQDLIMYLVGDVDQVQSVNGYVEALGWESGQAYAAAADAYVAGLYAKAGKQITLASAASSNVLAKLYEAQEHLMEKDVPFDEIAAVVSPKLWSRIAEAAAGILTDNGEVAANGKMARIRGMAVYVSNNLTASSSGHHCIVMSRGAIAYYDQIDKVEKFRESDYIGDIVRCLHTYGADVVRAQEMVDLSVTSYA